MVAETPPQLLGTAVNLSGPEGLRWVSANWSDLREVARRFRWTESPSRRSCVCYG